MPTNTLAVIIVYFLCPIASVATLWLGIQGFTHNGIKITNTRILKGIKAKLLGILLTAIGAFGIIMFLLLLLVREKVGS